MKKVCTKCGKSKELNQFYKQKTSKGGRRADCKECKSKSSRKNSKYNSSYYKKYYKEKTRVKNLIIGSIQRNYKGFRDKLNKSKFCSKCDEYKSFDEFYAGNGKYDLASNCRKCAYKCVKRYTKQNIQYRIRKNLSTRIWLALKKNIKRNSTINLLGCSLEDLKQHLEEQFEDGMSWDNYGEWHVDHIRPCDSYNLENRKEQKECFHYSNLQPLWAEDNLKKSNKMKY